MNSLKRFIKRTVLGGVFFLIPLVFLLMILEKAKEVLGSIIKPLADKWEISSLLGKSTVLFLVALLILLICFLGGLALKLPFFQKFNEFLEEKILHFLPGYSSLKLRSGFLEKEVLEKNKGVLFKLENTWHVGIVMEELNGYTTIFKPDAPEHKEGEVMIIASGDLVSIPVSMKVALSIITNFGEGASAIIAGHKK
jgi:uncharacterized membrane protein